MTPTDILVADLAKHFGVCKSTTKHLSISLKRSLERCGLKVTTSEQEAAKDAEIVRKDELVRTVVDQMAEAVEIDTEDWQQMLLAALTQGKD